MPSSETRSRERSRRTASGSAPTICRRAPVRSLICGHARSSTCSPLRGSWRPANVIVCSRPPGSACWGYEDAVGDHLPRPAEPPVGGGARLLGDGDALVDASLQEAPDRHPGLHPAELPRGMMRGHDRAACATASVATQIAGVIGSCRCSTSNRSRSSTARTRKGDARAQADVRQRAVRGHDHRAADRDHAGRRVPVPSDTGVECPGELPGGSLAMTTRTSCPRASSAEACSSACSTTAPQNDQENGTTMPIFTPGAYSASVPWPRGSGGYR